MGLGIAQRPNKIMFRISYKGERLITNNRDKGFKSIGAAKKWASSAANFVPDTSTIEIFLIVEVGKEKKYILQCRRHFCMPINTDEQYDEAMKKAKWWDL